MDVQPQYPSNALLFDSRTDQDSKKNMDCSSTSHAQIQRPPLFLDHQSYFLNGGRSSNRKRGREEITTITTMEQQQPSSVRRYPTLISLSELHPQWHHHQQQQQQQQQLQQPDSLVSTGLRLSVEGHHNQQANMEQQTTSPSDKLAAQIKHHSEELDRLLRSQEEQLRRALADTRRRQYRALVASAGEAATLRLSEREAELDGVVRRNAELESRVARLSADSVALQAKARADEAAALSLQAQLHQANADRAAAAVEDPAGSDAESACVDPRRERAEEDVRRMSAGGGGPLCRGCGGMAATVVVLPCRHLCVCRFCDPAVQACPVCFRVKSASVEVYLP